MYVCGQNCLSIEHTANEEECAKRKKEEQQEIALHYIGKCTTVSLNIHSKRRVIKSKVKELVHVHLCICV